MATDTHVNISVHEPEEVEVKYRWDEHNYPVFAFQVDSARIVMFPKTRYSALKLVSKLRRDLDLIEDQLSVQEDENDT